MTQKIKLMSDEEVKDFLMKECKFNATSNLFVYMWIAGQKITDECEKRAVELVKEAFKAGFDSGEISAEYSDETRDEAFQQFLKEQSRTEPPSLDNVQGFLDTIKEQEANEEKDG